MVKSWDEYILSGAIHQAVSLAPLILMRASGNTSCIMVRFRAQDLWQILKIKREDIPKTAFSTRYGLYEYYAFGG